MATLGGAEMAVTPAGSTFAGLSDARELDPKRIQVFWRHVERYDPGASVRPAAATVRRLVVVSGWAYETRILPDGRRQIFGFALPGDVVELPASSNYGQRALVALTRLEVVDAAVVCRADGPDGKTAQEAVERALQLRSERLFDHMVRIGRLTSKERVLNLLLELHDRLRAVHLVKDGVFRVPVTQEMFADTLGLSIVHINRTLQRLRRDGSIVVRGGAVTIPHPDRLASAACYPATWARAASANQGLA